MEVVDWGLGYYRLSDEHKIVYESIYDAIINRKQKAKIGRLCNQDEIIHIYRQVLSDNPEFFHVDVNSIALVMTTFCNYLEIKYILSDFEYEKAKNKLLVEVDRILKSEYVVYEKDEYKKMMIIFSYLQKNIDYDESELSGNYSVNCHNAYGAMVNKLCVCEGYSYALALLAKYSGIQSLVVCGELIGRGPHSWNIVKLNNEFYHIDSTKIKIKEKIENGCEDTNYKYFALSDKDIGYSHLWKSDMYPKCVKSNFMCYFYEDRLIESEAQLKMKIKQRIDLGKNYLDIKCADEYKYGNAKSLVNTVGNCLRDCKIFARVHMYSDEELNIFMFEWEKCTPII